ncbi:MMPL family transporter [Xylanimonas oleitrophica]|uniref:MMPL family transporter n=1 Tax=Xylanimonas oleitrophica TaxID=2607479 RepID=A0A2W5Y2S5_9MICO|nr:efflux RND transporter permease subunit [Xylanimonas oleitrophica]PZR51964.1 MMPL family transporter [Xylanimonas oleitrophica]
MDTPPRPAGHRASRPAPNPPRWLLVLVPAVLVAVWLALGAVGGPYFGRVGEVSTDDRASYLPSTAEATQVEGRLPAFTGDAVPAVVVVTGPGELTPADLTAIGQRLETAAAAVGAEGQASPPIPSDDGLAVQAFVPLPASADLAEATTTLREALRHDLPPGTEVLVTGPAGFAADLTEAFTGIDGLLLAAALAAVLVILVLVYRSPLLPLAVLATSVLALCGALLTVWWLARAGVLLLSGQTQGILFILVIGAATDYALLYVARYRDELRRTPDRWEATRRAWRGAVEPVLASGGTVIAGLLCLLLSDLRSNSSLGPVAATGIVFAMLAALTLLPAVLLLLGRAAFWPRRPTVDPQAPEPGADGGPGLWARVARLVARRPRAVWVTTAAVLAVGCAGLTQLDASGVPQSQLVLGGSEARAGQEVLAEHFPAGAGSPAMVLVPQEDLGAAGDVVAGQDGVAQVSVVAEGAGPAVPLERALAGAPAPLVVDGTVLLQATLTDPADSMAAEQTVRDLRTALAGPVPEALVGGSTATDLDTNAASVRDRTLIIPLVLTVILVILVLLLRAVLAPVLLVATTVLSFGTAMGVAALVFGPVLDLPGADPAVPLYGFVFLVALGIDYNIFLMSRVREETLEHGTREGVLRGLRLTGGIITSAGLVLAATFTALAVIPVLFLVQIAFIVAFGVLLDTFVVRSLLVPALVHDLGRVVWWPSRLARSAP